MFPKRGHDPEPHPPLFEELGGFQGGGHNSCMYAALVHRLLRAYRSVYGPFRAAENS